MTAPTIPAPDRDLHNTDPVVPPAAEDVSPITRAIFGSIAVGLGIALLVISIAAALFEASPLPGRFFNAEEANAAIFAGASALCFIGCGIMIFRRSLWTTFVLFVLALLLGYGASVVG